MYNKYICVGNLTRDPENKPVNDSGDSVTNLAVAVNNPLNKDEVFYADVQAWGKVGENCSKYLTKTRKQESAPAEVVEEFDGVPF